VLREEVNNFYFAYINNVLIYSSGSRKDYKEKVKGIVQKLEAARLHLDVNKSEFSVKKTKYLRFVIKAGQGVSIDLEKVLAITA
jgi:hypothetical protein